MNRNSAINLVNNTFKNEFNLENFKRFLIELFGLPPIMEPSNQTNYCGKEFNDYINQVYLLGEYEDEFGKSIGFFYIELSNESSRDRARTMQRNLIGKFLVNLHYDSALVAFYEENTEDWRFSHVKLEYEMGDKGIETKLSSPRRHSFLVGPNEPNHTCQNQFLDLLISEDRVKVTDIEEAFNIENVTDEFFKIYKDLFLKLADSLQKVKESDIKVKREFDNKNIKSSDFAKKLMGQLVFIYFLQKKGWLGVEKGADWGTGPKNFLRKIFDECIGNGDNFFNDILEHLFYEGLSEEVGDYHYSKFNYKVPFLNGGLFEPINNYDWKNTEVTLDNSIFSEILDTFDKFNFTVKEDEPLEKEVAVDPEMLGKVFENLLEVNDRKSKGAFYTPRYIVHYMCQENLISYLNTNSGLSEEDLRIFITKGDSAINSIIRSHEEKKKYNGRHFTHIPLPDSIKEHSDELELLLKNVKIIDPAVGSGAFPVGMMNEIVKARYVLRLLNDYEDIDMYKLKRETIMNSLYGVDIELSATDVTKLRFWLSLVVDEDNVKHIKPLPNLDNLIMCGNSLVEEYENIKLFDDKLINRSEQTKLVVSPLERIFNELESKKEDYFDTSGPIIKEELKNEIKKLKWDFIETHLKEIGKSNLIEKIKELNSNDSKPFFIWELEFSEIFKGKNPGFDIVIGNPPYVGEKGHAHIFDPIKETKWGKHFYLGKMDLFYFFYHKALDICKYNGNISFITTNYFITNKGALKLRKDFKERAKFIKLINFNELRIFPSALGQHNLITLIKKSNEPIISKNIVTHKKGLVDTKILNNILSNTDNETNYYTVPQDNLFDGEDNIIRLEGSGVFESGDEFIDNRNNLLKKLEDDFDFNLTKGEVIQGVVPNPDKVNSRHINKFKDFIKGTDIAKGDFVFTVPNNFFKTLNDFEKSLVKPLYEPNELEKYYVPDNSLLCLLYITRDNCNDINKIPNLGKHLEKYKFIMDNRRENKNNARKFYHLHWPRDESFFKEGPKIFSVRKCKEPTFVFLDSEAFCMLSCNIIKSDKMNLKALSIILNSKLIKFWLKFKGKLKGDIYQVDSDQIYQIPLKYICDDIQNKLILLYDELIDLTKEYNETYDKNNNEIKSKIEELMDKCNSLVYSIYSLDDNEINVVEENLNNLNV